METEPHKNLTGSFSRNCLKIMWIRKIVLLTNGTILKLKYLSDSFIFQARKQLYLEYTVQ
jgi:hypothetical protein